MRRSATVLVVLVVVVGMVGAVPMTGVAQQTPETETATPTDNGEANETDGNETDGNETAPGDLLEGAVGVQEAELEGEIENRTFGIQVAQAATEDAKAEVVANRLDAIEERLKNLEERKEELNESRESGNISEAEYRNEVAKLAVQTNNSKQLINRSANVSEGLPNETLEANGINVTAIRTLKERADELTGPEVAEIARSIAGPSVVGDAANASVSAGPPEVAGNATAASGGNATAGEGPPTDRPDDSDASDGAGGGSGNAADESDAGDSGGDGGSRGP